MSEFARTVRRISLAGFATLLTGMPLWATDYFVSNSGNDSNDGLSQTSAWATLDRMNAAMLAPGDRVLFARGGVWRGSLKSQSGASGQPITYSAYGQGAKPLFLGSVAKNQAADWTQVRSNIWQVGQLPIPYGTNWLPNPSFDTGTANWSLWVQGGVASASMSRDTNDYDSAPASLRIDCLTNGTSPSQIQLFTGQMTITNGITYTLEFSARCTQGFTIPKVLLHKYGSPYTDYTSWKSEPPTVGTNWGTYAVYFLANTNATDARITFQLGAGIPTNATLFLDTLSLRASSSRDAFAVDVGNLILNGGEAVGIKVWNESDLDQQNEFWFDESNGIVRMYSTNNPALLYANIECALKTNNINAVGVQWAVYDGLALAYSAWIGVSGVDTENIIVRNCDISFIGGGDALGGTNTLRAGNGIQFWADARDCLVENCRVWEIYDAALTAQSRVETTRQISITFRNNLIWNSEYSYEFWNGTASSSSSNVVFEYNTCLNAGGGWSHSQRPKPNGRHLMFYYSPAKLTNCLARHNIFSEATESCVYWQMTSQTNSIILDYNCYNQTSGYVAQIGTTNIAYTNFSFYQASSGQDANSFMADPQLEADGRLQTGSPCIDQATMPGWNPVPPYDLAGIPRTLDGNGDGVATPDIGCYEFVNQSVDNVGDGIPDYWRAFYFGGDGTTTNAFSGATADVTGTGQNNFFKYIAGLDPTNRASIFTLKIAPVFGQTNQQSLIYNPAISGRVYTIEFTTNLVSMAWTNLTSLAAPQTNGAQITVTDTNAIAPQQFYRLHISVP